MPVQSDKKIWRVWGARIGGGFFVLAGAYGFCAAGDHPADQAGLQRIAFASVMAGAASLLLAGRLGRPAIRVVALVAALFFTTCASTFVATAMSAWLPLAACAIAALIAAAWITLEIHLMIHHPTEAGGGSIRIEEADAF